MKAFKNNDFESDFDRFLFYNRENHVFINVNISRKLTTSKLRSEYFPVWTSQLVNNSILVYQIEDFQSPYEMR